jgi:TonB family protein
LVLAALGVPPQARPAEAFQWPAPGRAKVVETVTIDDRRAFELDYFVEVDPLPATGAPGFRVQITDVSRRTIGARQLGDGERLAGVGHALRPRWTLANDGRKLDSNEIEEAERVSVGMAAAAAAGAVSDPEPEQVRYHAAAIARSHADHLWRLWHGLWTELPNVSGESLPRRLELQTAAELLETSFTVAEVADRELAPDEIRLRARYGAAPEYPLPALQPDFLLLEALHERDPEHWAVKPGLDYARIETVVHARLARTTRAPLEVISTSTLTGRTGERPRLLTVTRRFDFTWLEALDQRDRYAPSDRPWAEFPEPATNPDGTRDPSYRRIRSPPYPAAEFAARLEGEVMVKVEVDRDGRPATPVVATSSGNANLDAAALAAVLEWRFFPKLLRGEPVPESVLVPVNFSLGAAQRTQSD